MANMNIEESKDSLKILLKIFSYSNIRFWLEKGTLLASVRHGEFIPWDDDVDLSVDAKNMSKISNTKYFFSLSKKYELYYVNGHYAIRNKKTKEHLICILPHKNINEKNYWIEFIPPLTYLVYALENQFYDSKDDWYLETPLKNVSVPSILLKFLSAFASKLHKKQTLIKLILKTQLFFHLYKKSYTSPSHHIKKLETSPLYDVPYPVPSEPKKYLDLLFGDWRIPKHKGKVVTEWDGKKIPMRYENDISS